MGVLEPVVEAFIEDVPTTPPGFRDLTEDGSEDDLFSEPKDLPKSPAYRNDLSFQSILPVLPAKGDFGYLSDLWGLGKQAAERKHCPGCLTDVKDDLRKIREVIEVFKKERDAAIEENKSLKEELDELKKQLFLKENGKKGDVRVTISNGESQSVEVLLKNKENTKVTQDAYDKKSILENSQKYGIQSFSISLPKTFVPKEKLVNFQLGEVPKSRKTVAELRKAFFENEFESEQDTFTARSYLEVKPEEPKELIRSKMNIRVKPKKKVGEIISKLTSKFIGSRVIPQAEPINMFQRFEKTRVVWESGLGRKVVA